MIISTVDDKTKKLPDVFCKATYSNNNKLLILDNELRAFLANDIKAVYESLDIYQATGKTLERYGNIVGQKRENLTDDQYRLKILSMISRKCSGTDYNSILSILAIILECDVSDIIIENDTEPGSVAIRNIPFTVLNNVGFTVNQAVDIINSLFPVTVTLSSACFEGTFSFANSEDIEVDDTEGFSDDNGTTGGYFGHWFS
jgi:hypothetical protein